MFAAAARLAAGRHLCAGMWVVSAVAVAVLNLDAAVVLCTPLAITVARRWQLDPVAMAFQPVLLACLASSALPVSNLTNLIAIAEGRIDAGTLVLRLGLPTLAAVGVGYAGWRLAFRRRALRPVAPTVDEQPPDGRCSSASSCWRSSSSGSSRPPCGHRALDGRGRRRSCAASAGPASVPWRAIPWGTAAVAAGLAVVATAAAQRAGVASWLVADGTWAQALRGAAAANVLNNLPAFLVALPHVTGTDHVLALLFGVNVGPTVLVTGSLAGLALARRGPPPGAGRRRPGLRQSRSGGRRSRPARRHRRARPRVS